MYETPITGLVLSGGGARAAYQVGVLRAIARLRRGTAAPPRRCPFGMICGTSAGAINAAALACNADQFDAAVEAIAQVWENFRVEQVYRADSLGVIRSGAQCWARPMWRRGAARCSTSSPGRHELDPPKRQRRPPRGHRWRTGAAGSAAVA